MSKVPGTLAYGRLLCSINANSLSFFCKGQNEKVVLNELSFGTFLSPKIVARDSKLALSLLKTFKLSSGYGLHFPDISKESQKC